MKDGIVVKNKDQSIVPQDEWIVFLAKDCAVPEMLRFYYTRCRQLGASEEQLEAIAQLHARVNAWRNSNLDKCKVPDVHPGEIVT